METDGSCCYNFHLRSKRHECTYLCSDGVRQKAEANNHFSDNCIPLPIHTAVISQPAHSCKSSRPTFNQLRTEANQSSANRVNLEFRFTAKLAFYLFFFSQLFYLNCLSFPVLVVNFTLNCRTDHHIFKKKAVVRIRCKMSQIILKVTFTLKTLYMIVVHISSSPTECRETALAYILQLINYMKTSCTKYTDREHDCVVCRPIPESKRVHESSSVHVCMYMHKRKL